MPRNDGTDSLDDSLDHSILDVGLDDRNKSRKAKAMAIVDRLKQVQASQADGIKVFESSAASLVSEMRNSHAQLTQTIDSIVKDLQEVYMWLILKLLYRIHGTGFLHTFMKRVFLITSHH